MHIEREIINYTIQKEKKRKKKKRANKGLDING